MEENNPRVKDVLVEGLVKDEDNGETPFGKPDRPELPIIGSLNVPITNKEEKSCEYYDS